MQKFFKFKDAVPKELQASIVYNYKCDSCNASYIGKTKRHLRSRIFEHFGKSVRTNNPISKPPFSAIRNHAHDNNHPMSIDSFSVLASTLHDMDLII